MDELECAEAVTVDQDFEELQVPLFPDHPEDAPDGLGRQPVRRESEDLIEDRERVAHPPVSFARDELQCIVRGLDGLLREHLPQSTHDVGNGQAAEVEALTTGEDRCRHLLDLLRLGRGKDEDDSGRRFLEDLEERVPRLAGEHVGLVDDVDLASALIRRSVHRALPEVPGVVDAPVRGRIDLDHVEGRRAVPDCQAGVTLPARLAPLPAGRRS